jgi:hypothetical protein
MDFVTTAVPPLIPGDIRVRNMQADKTNLAVVSTTLGTFATSALPTASTIPVGTIVMDTTLNVLKYVSTSGTWLTVATA